MGRDPIDLQLLCGRVSHSPSSDLSAGIGQWAAIQLAAPSLGVEVYPINVRDPNEIERALAALARSTSIGLIATGSALTVTHRDLIVGAAARYNLPAIYYESSYPHSGGPGLLWSRFP
jgi:putative ABC transport system substrate-binding protein